MYTKTTPEDREKLRKSLSPNHTWWGDGDHKVVKDVLDDLENMVFRVAELEHQNAILRNVTEQIKGIKSLNTIEEMPTSRKRRALQLTESIILGLAVVCAWVAMFITML